MSEKTIVRITRVITQTKIVELDLVGNNEEMIEDALADHMKAKANQYHTVEETDWDLEDIDTEADIEEYPEFEEDE